jgi:hypothetical protein
MAATLTPPTRHSDSERVRRRRDRHARLATDRALTEVAFTLRARERRERRREPGLGRELNVHEQIRSH